MFQRVGVLTCMTVTSITTLSDGEQSLVGLRSGSVRRVDRFAASLKLMPECSAALPGLADATRAGITVNEFSDDKRK